MRFLKRWTYWTGLFLIDACLIYLGFWLAFQTRFFYGPFTQLLPVSKGIPPWPMYQEALRAVVPLYILVFALWGRLYKVHFSNAADEFLAVVKSVTLATMLMVTATFLYRQYEYSRLVMAISWPVCVALVFLGREIWKAVIAFAWNHAIPPETVAVIGEGKSIQAITKLLSKEPHKNLKVFSPREIERISELIQKEESLEEIYISGQLLQDEALQNLVDECEDLEIEIKILPDLLEMRLGEIQVEDTWGIPILHLKPLSLHGLRFWVKRSFDLTLSVLIVSLGFFPFLLLALLIKLDSEGGIFFVQERVGFKEKRFKCMKFRTMRKDAEQMLETMHLPSFRGGPAFKMKDDPRITRVGRWLRKFSLDELPQIWNVLRGEMSLIGPRPQVLTEAAGNPEWARRRYRILPGITGLWQVSGRADLTYEDMMRLDIYYLENWSPGLDLRIVLKTLPVVLGSKGAY